MSFKIIKWIDKKFLFSLFKNLKNNFYYLVKLKLKKKSIINSLENKCAYENKSFIIKNNNKISGLCELYGSDKGYINLNKEKPYPWKSHSYSNFYFNLFNHFKNEIKLLFECGIGSNNPKIISNMGISGKPGASLRVWRDYFKNAQIYGADIDKNCLFQDDRIKTFYVDQLNNESIKEMWKNISKDNFDIIIDDGLHSEDASTSLFFNSFHKLKDGGIYIIEDVHYNYINSLYKKLFSYSPEVIILNDNQRHITEDDSVSMDNNLIIIRKIN
jgi:hypothetical protein